MSPRITDQNSTHSGINVDHILPGDLAWPTHRLNGTSERAPLHPATWGSTEIRDGGINFHSMVEPGLLECICLLASNRLSRCDELHFEVLARNPLHCAMPI